MDIGENNVDKLGLTDEEVLKRRKQYGDNKIIEAKPDTFYDKFKESFGDPMIKLLLIIACLMSALAIMGYLDFKEIIGIIASVLIVTVVSAKTQVKADTQYRKLKDSVKKDTCKVYRNGKVFQENADNLVVGDVVILQSGDKIPADGFICKGSLMIDNSSLNGETEECKKTAVSNSISFEEAAITSEITGDTFVDKHSLFKGTTVLNGEGIEKVTRVGMNTMMGKMAKDMSEEEVESPLNVKLTKLAKQISIFGYIGSIIIAIVLLMYKVSVAGGFELYFAMERMLIFKDILEAVMLSIVIIVMAVPEGLPLMIAIVLMQNTGNLLNNNVLVRKPIGIETAGSLNILFSDKTGTITKGNLKVVEFFDGNLNDTYKDGSKIKEMMQLCIGKNTCAMFDLKGNAVGGNITDKALLNFLTQTEMEKLANINVEKSQEFNSTNKYSATQLKECTVYKGAPEKLLDKATKMLDENGNIVAIDKNKINSKIDKLATRAMRVLSFAYSKSSLIENNLPDDLVIVGFVGIRDDVRQEAKTAIEEIQNAGIQVVMITGDKKETAMAIAKEASLLNSDTDIVLTSEDLKAMTDDEIKNILPNLRVIARALPTDKSRMVRLAQELNLVCGMTGDGVNDAPALKRADVGFAMGSGTEVAKEASSIVILDDNLKSIENAILYGRTIYNNILKFVKFQLTINVGAVIITALAPFFGIEEPLKITHILWINLVMDGLGAIALGGEPALKKYMNESPKSRTQSLVSKDMMGQILFAGLWITVLSFMFLKLPIFINIFENEAQHMTAYFSLFVLFSVFNGFNVRSDDVNLLENIKENKGFLNVMSIIVLIQILLTFLGGELFNCTPFGIIGWFTIIGVAMSIIPFDILRKLAIKHS